MGPTPTPERPPLTVVLQEQISGGAGTPGLKEPAYVKSSHVDVASRPASIGCRQMEHSGSSEVRHDSVGALERPLAGLFRVHGGAIDFCPSQVDGGDSPCIGDVVQWVCLKHEEVRTLPGFDGTRIAQTQQSG